MTTQQPLGSGFGARSTATEVLAGMDLTGKVVVLTGGYSGLGLEATRALVAAGAEVVVPARRVDEAERALAGLSGVSVVACDLADLVSVANASATIGALHPRIDALIASAGIMARHESRTPAGWELHLATNHVGHFALLAGLWPALVEGAARVVLVSSGAHRASAMRWDDPHFTGGYDWWAAYGQSKTANALTALHLDTVGAPQGVRSFSLDPGAILTPLQRQLPTEEMVRMGWIDSEGRAVDPSFKTPQQGASTMVWAAFSPLLAGHGGVFCADTDIAPLGAVAPHARDAAEAARLWEWTADLTGLRTGA